LHLPVSVDANLASIGDSPDYFFSLLSWFGWLIIKIFASFIGAFFVIRADTGFVTRTSHAFDRLSGGKTE